MSQEFGISYLFSYSIQILLFHSYPFSVSQAFIILPLSKDLELGRYITSTVAAHFIDWHSKSCGREKTVLNPTDIKLEVAEDQKS